MPTLTTEQLQSLAEYQRLRDAPRNAIQNGVYPNIKKALASYAALDAALSGDLSEWGETHAGSMAEIAPHVADLITHMQAIVKIVEGIVSANPLTFPDIELDA